jgi:hypothetical protein
VRRVIGPGGRKGPPKESLLSVAKGDNTVDLREHYFAHRHWFFGALLGGVVFSLSKELTLYGRLPHPLDLGFQLSFGAIAILGILQRREWFHKLLAPVSAVLFLLYIGLIFRNLHQ